MAVFVVGCSRTAKEPPVAAATESERSRIDDRLGAVQASNSSVDDDAEPLAIPKLLEQQAYIGPLADAYRRLDPQNDGWDSEAFGELAISQLNRLAAAIEGGGGTEKLCAPVFAAPRLVLDQLPEVYRDESLVVRRSSNALLPAGSSSSLSLAVLVQDLRRELGKHPHAKFKLYRVDVEGRGVRTQAYFHVDGQSATEGGRELTATVTVTWQPVSEAQPTPLLANMQFDALEVVESRGGKPLFDDCTRSVFAGDVAYQQQLLRSTDDWRSRLCRDYGLDVVANHGIAIADVNGDMLEDVYVCQQGGIPNRLFLQQPDGTLKDASAASGTDWLDYTASALIVDIDNDGDRDLVVGQERSILLMRNDGTGQFELVKNAPSRAQTFSLAAADYDLDGDLDVYCCGYNSFSDRARTGAMGEPIPYHDAQNGGPNLLLKNLGNWDFADATAETGLEQNNNRFSFAASWEDYDNDGDMDLYVANDYGRNNLYRNQDGRFLDVAAELEVQDMSAGMSISWADMNRDGWMDFYVSNMFSAAGNRITYQRQFKEGASADMKKQYQRHARGNSLFQSDGNGRFRDVSEVAGVTMGRWAWGSRFCDINNDGWQDILVNNGFISSTDTGDL